MTINTHIEKILSDTLITFTFGLYQNKIFNYYTIDKVI